MCTRSQGWRLAVELQEPLDHALRAKLGCSEAATSHSQIRAWGEAAGVQALLCTHTCLPFFQDVPTTRESANAPDNGLVVCNNGSAGMPNFSGLTFGLATRVSSDPGIPHDSLYGLLHRGLRYDAIAISYDQEAWLGQFQSLWPKGSAAYESYYNRIRYGPEFAPTQAARGNVQLYV